MPIGSIKAEVKENAPDLKDEFQCQLVQLKPIRWEIRRKLEN